MDDSASGEFARIDLILAQQELTDSTGVALGPGDDAALLTPPSGMALALTVDTLVEGVHFPEGLSPERAMRRALAVNLSDLAAMGAAPGPCLLAVTHPDLDAETARAIGRGFAHAARGTGAALVGGNLARGPFSLSVTAGGWVPAGAALRRDGARVGDLVCVSGVIGAGAAALRRYRHDGVIDDSARAYLEPVPRLALGVALRDHAHACIDVSDGLLADLAQLCRASGVRGVVTLDAVPVDGDAELAVTAGDDYELLFTLPPNAAPLEMLANDGEVAITVIGRIEAGRGIALESGGVERSLPARLGWDHFA